MNQDELAKTILLALAQDTKCFDIPFEPTAKNQQKLNKERRDMLNNRIMWLVWLYRRIDFYLTLEEAYPNPET